MRIRNQVLLLVLGVGTTWQLAEISAQAQCMRGGSNNQPRGSSLQTPATTNPALLQSNPLSQAYNAQLQQAYAAQLQQAYNVQLQQAYAAGLARALQTIYLANNVTPAQQQDVASSLNPMFSGSSYQPASANLDLFTDDLTKAVSSGKMTPRQAARLSQDAAEVANAGPDSRSARRKLKADLKALKTAGKMSGQEVQTLSDDIETFILPVRQDEPMKRNARR
jgi:hypothetical protein